jgi:inositol-phosphate phosphatase / L-galactose 1-phosphate phosphatase / histidinol-phosphatase
LNALQLDQHLELANRLADAVRPVSMAYFRSALEIDNKSDESPVSIADREAETTMRAIIETAHPDHGIVGEEHGNKNEDADFVWVLDPIDGTQAFVTGKPLFGTLIALMHEGVSVLGIIDMPALSERWVGAKGRPTLFQDKPISVRPCASLADAWLYATSPQMFTDANFPKFENLRKSTRRAVYGAECQGYGLMASGWADIVCEDTLQPYDYAAIVPIVEGAGGIMTDWQGRALDMQSDGAVLASGNAALHEQAIETLK